MVMSFQLELMKKSSRAVSTELSGFSSLFLFCWCWSASASAPLVANQHRTIGNIGDYLQAGSGVLEYRQRKTFAVEAVGCNNFNKTIGQARSAIKFIYQIIVSISTQAACN